MRRRFRLLVWIAALAAAPATAREVVVSARPDAVAVTIYRAPHRDADEFIDIEDDLEGFALISETRTVDLPPGEVTVRFEGVASGIQPQTAILQGAVPREKNQDRRLLSEAGLIDAFTGQRVIVRRTDRATGKVTEERARIRSSTGGIILETDKGFESLSCTGLSQAPIYPDVPAGLSAKPVLSMTTSAQPGGRQQLTLSYIAGNFDWQANYVGEVSEDTNRVDLFAWVTLASLDDTSFEQAKASVVAGRVRRERDEDNDDDDDSEFWSTCWPNDTTGAGAGAAPLFRPNPLPEIEAPITIRSEVYGYGGGGGEEEASIVVTGSRIMRPESFADFKLYRVPFPVTVASRGLKQVAFLNARRIKGELVYRSRDARSDDDPEWLFRFRNLKRDGIGQPLPMGQVALFQKGSGRRLLIGETSVQDKAVGEDVEFAFEPDFDLERSNAVTVDTDWLEDDDDDSERMRLTVSNANPFPIRYEAEFPPSDYRRFDRFSAPTFRRKGVTVWRVLVRAGGTAKLEFRESEIEPQDEDEDEDAE